MQLGRVMSFLSLTMSAIMSGRHIPDVPHTPDEPSVITHIL
jgi:hypothetical protein